MLDIIAVGWIVLSIVVLASARASRYLVLATLGSTLLAFYCAAAVWWNGALSVAVDDQSAQQHIRAAVTFEALTAVAASASVACLVLAWRRRSRRRANDGLDASHSAVQSGTR